MRNLNALGVQVTHRIEEALIVGTAATHEDHPRRVNNCRAVGWSRSIARNAVVVKGPNKPTQNVIQLGTVPRIDPRFIRRPRLANCLEPVGVGQLHVRDVQRLDFEGARRAHANLVGRRVQIDLNRRRQHRVVDRNSLAFGTPLNSPKAPTQLEAFAVGAQQLALFEEVAIQRFRCADLLATTRPWLPQST